MKKRRSLGPAARALLVATSLTASIGPLGSAELSWLPDPVEDGAAQQLADRLLALGDTGSDPDAVLAGARQMLRAMRDGIDGWGVAGALAKAPGFAGIVLPAAAQPALDAMGRWSICNLDLFLRYDAATRAGNGGAALAPALGLTAVTLVILRLREPFVAAGGQQPEIEAHLTSAGFESVLAAIQGSPELRAQVAAACEPSLRELLAAPIVFLREQGARNGR